MSAEHLAALACPRTLQSLRLATLEEANADAAPLRPLPRVQKSSHPVGVTAQVLLREDGQAAYPLVHGVPILLAPEMLVRDDSAAACDISLPPYAEAYEEMSFYDDVAAQRSGDDTELERSARMLRQIRDAGASGTFPEPHALWLDADFDGAAQLDCYEHLRGGIGGAVMQLGGKGLHAVKFLLAGAREAWLLTPMLEEARWALDLAEAMGVRERMHVVVAVAEEPPFQDAQFDAIYAGGTMHHLVIGMAAPALRRILRDGGALAAAEPWKAAGYEWGVRMFGKREPSVHCRPIDDARLSSFFETFPDAECRHHGALFRYPLIALNKLGIRIGGENVRRVIRFDDALIARFAAAHRLGSGLAILATK